VNIKNIAVGLAGVGVIGAIALGNSVAFADDTTNSLPPISSSGAPLDQQIGHKGPRELVTAAEYLGLTQDELFAELQSGKTLAQVAEAQGKSVQGLIDALVAEATTKITDMVNNPLPPKPEGFGPRGHHGGMMGEDYSQNDDIDYSAEEQSETGVNP
jgi:hypothetical protein